MNKKRSYNGIFVLIIGLIFLALYIGSQNTDVSNFTRGELVFALTRGDVAAVTIQPFQETPTGEVRILLSNGERRTFYVTDTGDIEQLLRDYGIDAEVLKVPSDSWFLTSILPILLVVVVVVFFFVMMNNQNNAAAGGNRMMSFGKSRAKLAEPGGKISLKDVAGLKEEKEDLEEIVEFLKHPAKFAALGARIPKGILLEGAPGTGKTLLAKAIAGEADVPFFTISGSDFVEMFVGVGASRVRDLFEESKKNAPCIIFIDEIDAVARRRGTGLGGGHDEREQTLNQLLVEMDGFGVNEGIIVLAATNRVDILDPAILRPGRFDRKLSVNRPDVGGREDILKIHARNKPLAEDVDLKQVAQTTAGFTGADLENLLNEAAIAAAMKSRAYVVQEDIHQSFIKIGIGGEKRSRVISEKEKRITAYHEAGHAVLFHELPEVGPVHIISVIPNGLGAAGYTMPLPERDDVHITKSKMEQEIMVGLGGRIAEELVFNDITTGASADIKRVTATARHMVTKFGMSSNIGTINYSNDDHEVFIGRDLATAKSHSDETAAEIDREVKNIITACYERAKVIINHRRDILDKCVDLLMEKERITREEFEALYEPV